MAEEVSTFYLYVDNGYWQRDRTVVGCFLGMIMSGHTPKGGMMFEFPGLTDDEGKNIYIREDGMVMAPSSVNRSTIKTHKVVFSMKRIHALVDLIQDEDLYTMIETT